MAKDIHVNYNIQKTKKVKFIYPEQSNDFKTAYAIYTTLDNLLYRTRIGSPGSYDAHGTNALESRIKSFKSDTKNIKYKDVLKQCVDEMNNFQATRKYYKRMIVSLQKQIALICADENEKWGKEMVKLNKEAGIIK